MQLIIGSYIFELSSSEYDKLTRTQSWRWVQRERLNRKPAVQYQGSNLQKVSLSGTIHVENGDHREQQDRMIAEGNLGVPLNILANNSLGLAVWLGRWVIEQVSFDETDILGTGAAKTVGFKMQIMEYGDDNV